MTTFWTILLESPIKIILNSKFFILHFVEIRVETIRSFYQFVEISKKKFKKFQKKFANFHKINNYPIKWLRFKIYHSQFFMHIQLNSSILLYLKLKSFILLIRFVKNSKNTKKMCKFSNIFSSFFKFKIYRSQF